MTDHTEQKIYFIWGLKRSGIHYFTNWLYANLGGTIKCKLSRQVNRHPQLQRGFCDPKSDVFFFNNCGHLYSRDYSLGEVTATDFEIAARPHRVTIFGIEDADIAKYSACVQSIPETTHILVMRDPLNNIASRLKGADQRPGVFPVNHRYIDLYESYSREFIGHTDLLKPKFEVAYNTMVQDPVYRNNLALRLGLTNNDAVGQIPKYGGGSSFSGTQATPANEVLERYKQQAIEREIIEQLLSKSAIRTICRAVFGYELEEVAKEMLRQ